MHLQGEGGTLALLISVCVLRVGRTVIMTLPGGALRSLLQKGLGFGDLGVQGLGFWGWNLASPVVKGFKA